MFKRFLSKFAKTAAAPAPTLKEPVKPPVRPALPADFDPNQLAYDMILDPAADSAHPAVAGWCFGLPPGITPEQWPLDPESGYPLQHGFTLRLPNMFKVQGPDVVAISFFGCPADHCDGMPTTTPGLLDLIANPGAAPPADAALIPFWQQSRTGHPRLHRMVDILGCQYAVISLTQDEFAGPPCPVPEIAHHPRLAGTPQPHWLKIGGAAAALGLGYPGRTADDAARSHNYDVIGGMPEMRPDYRVPIVLRARHDDPNAGIGVEDERYVPSYDDDYELHAWAADLPGRCHLGGTMFPCQATPPIGPHYIEIEEYFGNFNFGTGNAQLDLKTFAFDWAC